MWEISPQLNRNKIYWRSWLKIKIPKESTILKKTIRAYTNECTSSINSWSFAFPINLISSVKEGIVIQAYVTYIQGVHLATRSHEDRHTVMTFYVILPPQSSSHREKGLSVSPSFVNKTWIYIFVFRVFGGTVITKYSIRMYRWAGLSAWAAI